jgi:hypothetical protein
MKNTHRKTYGVDGLIDWHVELKAGKARMVVDFSGGGLTSFGATPAQFTTENILYQHIIENSEYYKRGKIRLMRSTSLTKKEEKAEPVKPQKRELVRVETVKNCSDARNWLRDNKNISLGAKTKQEILDIAAANGVEFPNISK